MSGIILTTVKADTRIQHCTISDPFKNYKPEEEKYIEKFRVEEDKTLRQLIDVFKRVRYGGDKSSYREEYEEVLSLVCKLKYTASDITKFLIVLPKFQKRKYFNFNTGLFLSALINNCKDEEFVLVTELISSKIDCVGYMNSKRITIQGNIGDYIGRSMEGGIITIHGNVGNSVGFEMTGGTISIEGDYEWLAHGCVKGGNVFHKGRQIVKDGMRLL